MNAIAILRKRSMLFLHRQKRRGRLVSEGRFFSPISDIFRRFGTGMPQQLLNIPQISAPLEHMHCKGVPQRMCRHMLRDIGLLPSPLYDLLNRSFGYMTTGLRTFKKPLNWLILFDIRRYHLTCQIRVQGIAVLGQAQILLRQFHCALKNKNKGI